MATVGDLLILGTDTDAGKTTFALLWLALFGDRYEYWKPVETGPSDTEKVREFVAGATVHAPLCRFDEPVAPPLAARRLGQRIPAAGVVVARKPAVNQAGRGLVIETFGGPFSPLNDDELQIELVRRLCCPSLLVSSSTLGAIGRTLQCLLALGQYDVHPAAVVLLGPRDDFALEQVSRHRRGLTVVALAPPEEWTPAGILRCAAEQADVLCGLRDLLAERQAPSEHPDRDILERDRRVVWHPYTSLKDADPPLVCVAAQDEFLELADGRRVIDGISSWWTILHGHRHPPLMTALREASHKYDHVHFAGVTHPPAVDLAELLLGSIRNHLKGNVIGRQECLPHAAGRVFYSDNGSTAVEVALKMAYQFWRHHGEPRRTRFVGFEHGYHGDTFGAMAVSRDPLFFGPFEPLLFQADILPLAAEALDAHLAKHAAETAAIIIEPLVQGAGGMRMHTPQVLRAIYEASKKHGVLFIADEVMTGGGRLGSLWAHTEAGIAPDLICAAKTLAGGILPLAATIAAPHIVQAFDTADRARTFFHGHSFTAHPLACAVAAANWRILSEQQGPAPARRLETFWNQELQPLRGQPGIKDVRIRGSIAAIEVQAEGGYLADVGRVMRRAALERGVLLRPLGNVLYAMPPLCTSPKSLGQVRDALMAAVRASVK